MSLEKTRRNEDIVIFVQQGGTRTEAARKWGVSRTRVGQIVNPSLGVHQGYNPLTDAERDKILSLAKSGLCVSHIATEVRRTEATVQRCLNKAGIAAHNQGDTFGPGKRQEALTLLSMGLTPREAADRLKMTRNAVIGASWRARQKQGVAP